MRCLNPKHTFSYNCSVQDPMSAVILNDGFNMLTGEDVKKRSSRSEGMVHHGAMDQGQIWSDVPLRRNLSLPSGNLT